MLALVLHNLVPTIEREVESVTETWKRRSRQIERKFSPPLSNVTPSEYDDSDVSLFLGVHPLITGETPGARGNKVNQAMKNQFILCAAVHLLYEERGGKLCCLLWKFRLPSPQTNSGRTSPRLGSLQVPLMTSVPVEIDTDSMCDHVLGATTKPHQWRTVLWWRPNHASIHVAAWPSLSGFDGIRDAGYSTCCWLIFSSLEICLACSARLFELMTSSMRLA